MLRVLNVISRIPRNVVECSLRLSSDITYSNNPVPSSSNQNDVAVTNDLVAHMNNALDPVKGHSFGRLFAVVQMNAQQYKITNGDIIAVTGIAPYKIGDKIFIEKVLMVGSQQFSLFGTPLLPKAQVRVSATVIEKTITNVEPDFFFIRRKDVRILRFRQKPINLLRINDIKVQPELEPIEQDDISE